MMPGKDRDGSGKYTTSYSDATFLGAVEELGPEVGAQAVFEKVGCGRDTAYRRLRSLEDAGEIRSRKVGMARLWTIAD
jgi:GTP-sensing pleiotropic transcriptional regulator CodY